MRTLLIEVDDELADRLDRVAPARSGAELVRTAILKAIGEAEEQAVTEAYARQPDSLDAAFDPTVWEDRSTLSVPQPEAFASTMRDNRVSSKLEILLEAARRATWDALHGPKHLRAGRFRLSTVAPTMPDRENAEHTTQPPATEASARR